MSAASLRPGGGGCCPRGYDEGPCPRPRLPPLRLFMARCGGWGRGPGYGGRAGRGRVEDEEEERVDAGELGCMGGRCIGEAVLEGTGA